MEEVQADDGEAILVSKEREKFGGSGGVIWSCLGRFWGR